jgi:uncharacterized protein
MTHELLMVERNENWMNALEGYIERGGVFIAAGAAHYVGEDSVVTSLKERGYDVTRVPPADSDE